MNVKLLSILVVLLTLLAVGCIQTKEAQPATIPDDALSHAGWVKQGEVQKQTLEREVAGVNVSINLASQTYVDAGLVQRLLNDSIATTSQLIDTKFSALSSAQRERLKNEVGDSLQQMLGQLRGAAVIYTTRVVLPANIPVPDSLMDRIIDGLVQTSSNNVEGLKNLKKVSEEEFTTENGKTAKASIYHGILERNGQSVNVELLACHWNDAGSTIVALGIYPYGKLTYPVDVSAGGVSVSEPVSITIDEEQMKQEVLSLIKKVQ
ncbi:MAG: hypothetical protein ACXQS9_02965 [Methermicoccaceae archaeon]